MPIKNCEVCGSEFKARLTVVRTCSLQCRNQLISSEKSLRYQKTSQCVVCQGAFKVGATDANKQTCSVACSYKLRGSKTSKGETLKCKTCGSEFYAKLSQQKGIVGGGSYCSKACLYSKNLSAMERACVCCGKKFSSPPSQARVLTCSTKCGYEWFSGYRHGNYVGATYRALQADGTFKVFENRWYASKKNTGRRTAKDRATPAWADHAAIRAVYDAAVVLELTTGEKYHVDHMVPLKSKMVSGLHNQYNLQVIPRWDNLSKGNRHWPDMW